ncbi:hypothetical protein SAMN05444672_12347 [Bacillus sp. OK838]|nr:hypothetical protein SAMN05444672_12347 [Bacillus sp. OK838]
MYEFNERMFNLLALKRNLNMWGVTAFLVVIIRVVKKKM